jgi:hypothetical protein
MEVNLPIHFYGQILGIAIHSAFEVSIQLYIGAELLLSIIAFDVLEGHLMFGGEPAEIFSGNGALFVVTFI